MKEKGVGVEDARRERVEGCMGTEGGRGVSAGWLAVKWKQSGTQFIYFLLLASREITALCQY